LQYLLVVSSLIYTLHKLMGRVYTELDIACQVVDVK
jgi:hypothetical protein